MARFKKDAEQYRLKHGTDNNDDMDFKSLPEFVFNYGKDGGNHIALKKTHKLNRIDLNKKHHVANSWFFE